MSNRGRCSSLLAPLDEQCALHFEVCIDVGVRVDEETIQRLCAVLEHAALSREQLECCRVRVRLNGHAERVARLLQRRQANELLQIDD